MRLRFALRRLRLQSFKMVTKTNGPIRIRIALENSKQASKWSFWRSPTFPQYISMFAVTISAFSFGNVLGWSSPALSSISASGHFHNLTTTELSCIGSLITIGAVPGSMFGGSCIGKIGRRNTLILSAIPLTLGWLSIATATRILMIFIGRFLKGFGIGMICVSAPVYVSEFLQPDIRGRLGSVFFIVAKFGILLTFLAGWYLPYNYLAAVCAPIPIIFALAVAFLPESPRYLLSQGDTKTATDALRWFRGGKHMNLSKDKLNLEIAEMLNEITNKTRGNVRFVDLLRLKPFIIVLGLMFFNQFCGGNYFGFYTVGIFEEVGSGLDSHLSAIIVGVFLTLATILTTCFVDTVGRKLLLFWAFIIMVVSLATLGTVISLKSGNVLGSQTYNWISLVSLVLYNAAYNGGVSGLVWTVESEILPGNVIGYASGLASTFNWILAFVVTRYFVEVNEVLGQQNTVWVFTLFCTLGAGFVYAFVPETKLISLTRIQHDNFSKNDINEPEPT